MKPTPYLKVTGDRESLFRELLKAGCHREGYTSYEEATMNVGWPLNGYVYIYVNGTGGIRGFQSIVGRQNIICMNDVKSFLMYVRRHITGRTC